MNIKERAVAAAKLRPIHVYLLRYTDKVKILKAATKALKDKVFFHSQIYISDDSSTESLQIISNYQEVLDMVAPFSLLVYTGSRDPCSKGKTGEEH